MDGRYFAHDLMKREEVPFSGYVFKERVHYICPIGISRALLHFRILSRNPDLLGANNTTLYLSRAKAFLPSVRAYVFVLRKIQRDINRLLVEMPSHYFSCYSI